MSWPMKATGCVILLACIALAGCLDPTSSNRDVNRAWLEGMTVEWLPNAELARNQTIECADHYQSADWHSAIESCAVAERTIERVVLDLMQRNGRDLPGSPEASWALWRAARNAMGDANKVAGSWGQAAQMYADSKATNETLEAAQTYDRAGALGLSSFEESWMAMLVSFETANREQL
jgi:hypothetical protein